MEKVKKKFKIIDLNVVESYSMANLLQIKGGYGSEVTCHMTPKTTERGCCTQNDNT